VLTESVVEDATRGWLGSLGFVLNLRTKKKSNMDVSVRGPGTPAREGYKVH
jgi:hypothetical protein